MNFSNFTQGGPWAWFVSDEVFPPEFIKSLSDTFPDEKLILTERKIGSDKSYLCKQAKIYSVLDDNILDTSSLDACWDRLITMIKSDEYKNKVEKLLDVKLSGAWIEVVINQYYENCFMSIHTDRKPKLITQLIYLSGIPGCELGGEFLIHNKNGEVIDAIEPLPGRSLIFKRTENSYHSVNKMHKKFKRNSIQIVFWEHQPPATAIGRITHLKR
ncbi:2OG-Fe(II) oxygenase [Serratia quinivorans]|uniref:2OG-Fe(II) oxygenase n=1 Tax=Serratia quinivorans TaxID=137545 RepID=UPI001C46BBFB|nr:2OG-Fe(II) oxygenase [Serratia quinivorans]MBV6695150.1 2OG-Fe(II) oxygenase [Serratia quinivorans]